MHQWWYSAASRWALCALAVGGAVLLTTAFRAQPTRPTSTASHGSGHLVLAPISAQAEFDQLFIDMMVPHHQGAVELARIAQDRAEHQEIKNLAVAVVQGQTAEIDQMKAWRLAWYGSADTPALSAVPILHDMGGQVMSTDTMDMAQEVEMVRNAPEPFDRSFIDAMIPHHESAIDAAQAAQARAVHQEIKDLARAIISAQQTEIDQMKAWRLAWYGASTSPTALPDAPIHAPGAGH
jgi:uncharacterized protein (DUF305 family)